MVCEAQSGKSAIIPYLAQAPPRKRSSLVALRAVHRCRAPGRAPLHAPPRPPASPDVVTVTDSITLADRIEDLLPQTQCTKCGYTGCRPYAEAIASGEADLACRITHVPKVMFVPS